MILVLIIARIKVDTQNSKEWYDMNNDWFSGVFGVADFVSEVKNSKWQMKYNQPNL